MLAFCKQIIVQVAKDFQNVIEQRLIYLNIHNVVTLYTLIEWLYNINAMK